ncbi:GTP-binding protein [Candidatus Puniceispirillum sp.]|nr:GTP-binding protein [Candidatus Puniceispirillum sp.]
MGRRDNNIISRRFPISVLTGFLGSGKTTVLNYLTQQPSLKRALLLINEFGEIGIDSDLVTRVSDDVVIEMSSGCICCSIRSDITDTLTKALRRFSKEDHFLFDRVIIETTGLADPAPIIQTLMAEPKISSHFYLQGVVATVDAVNGGGTLDKQIEAVKQVAVADQVLVTKTDLADKITLERLQNRVRLLNPAAPQVLAKNGVVDPAALLHDSFYDPNSKSIDLQNWLKAESYSNDHNKKQGHHHHHDDDDINRHHAQIKPFCLTIDEPILNGALDIWLRTLLMFRGADLLRIKGIVNVVGENGPIIIHAVQHILHPKATLEQWPSEDHRSRIVFITRNIDPSELIDSLKSLTIQNT